LLFQQALQFTECVRALGKNKYSFIHTSAKALDKNQHRYLSESDKNQKKKKK
jgi:hypothetical protein